MRHHLRRRYGHMNVWAGETVVIRLRSADGTLLRSFKHRPSTAMSTSEIALWEAGSVPSGTLIDIVLGGRRWRYRVGRLAGHPSVTRVRG